MRADQRTGALIVVVSIVLIAIVLLMSDGWGLPQVPLYLYNPYVAAEAISAEPGLEWAEAPVLFFASTRNDVSILLIALGYGVCSYFSLLPQAGKGRETTTQAPAVDAPAESSANKEDY